MLLLTLAGVGCDAGQGGSDAAVAAKSEARSREVLAEAWDTLWTVGASANDTVLLNPYLVAASDSGVYLFDGGNHSVLALGPEGGVRWRFGRQGSGPDEFRGVRDLKTGSDGSVLVLDPRNGRIIRLNAAGGVRSRIPLGATGHAEQLASLDSGRIVLLTMDPARAFAIMDSVGNVRERFSLPWAGFAALDQIARQGLIAPSGGGGWIFGFSMGDGWFTFNGSASVGSASYVEHTDFPAVKTTSAGATQMAEYNACSACSASVSDSTLYVHFGGYGPHPESVIDLYHVNARRYLGSFILPMKATAIAAAGDRIYALRDDPYPMLLALRPRTKPVRR
ncbi:MAG TPA: hypothetical protein VE913_17315 [Longimicrobium sp.]|nr:hypothetical protein [Longimicrobium sp.]